MRPRAWFLVVLLLCLYVAADSTTCSAIKRCEQGCCNKNGNCGFGPDYCDKSVCRSDCERLSECNPGFGAAWAKSETCPLNVCCSKHGYCGTTKDFCGSKTVKRPSCGKGGEMERVVGYFEGWAKDRPCEVFWPEKIPTGLYTHINYAFGIINPTSFHLESNGPEDEAMYERLMLLKKRDPNLKIYLAVGGWTFNDPGPTAHVFSELAASEERQNSFFGSVQSFMSFYKFDGLDIDWEYPVDDKRGGKNYDYTTFPKFMAKLKKMMDKGNKGLTITLPASYWYLQYFDIKKLEPTVDFFNIMSYDLHGAWDQNVNWTSPYLNAHTNLTEVESALDLLWRNDISSSKVVMGLGFYGRAFTMDEGACREPGCLFDGPANMGSCSREKGILLNSEIDNEIKRRNLKPKLYEEEAVKVITWGKQWVSYDDEETLQMKVDRAGERCLGGVMVWAISHDTQDAKYNEALADILGRDTVKGSIGDEEKSGEWKDIPYEQCRWSNCKESCPKGWVHIRRSDPDRNQEGELMYDETGCGGDGHHSFCCPPGEEIPKCGWYNHDRGKCQKSTSCPPKMVEIGSNQMYCDNKPDVQTACCETTSKSMKVYATCQWGTYPDCDAKPVCGDEYYYFPMVESGGGSGGLQCNNLKNDLGVDILGVQTRKYCCNTQSQPKFTDCRMYRAEGPMISGQEPGVCRSNCPSDRVRVAIDWPFQVCSAYEVGGQAWCCKTDYSHEEWKPNERIADYKDDMAKWVKNPTCPNPSKVFKRHELSSSSTELAVRAVKGNAETIEELLTNILGLVGSQIMLSQLRLVWNQHIRPRYPWLQITYMSNYIRQNWRIDWEGPAAFARKVLCNPRFWADQIEAFLSGNEDDGSDVLNCTKTSVCYSNGNCDDPWGDVDGTVDNKRRHVNLFGRHSNHLSHPSQSRHNHHRHHHPTRTVLVPRANDNVDIPDEHGEKHRYRIAFPPHPRPSILPDDDPLLNYVVVIRTPGNCFSPKVVLKKWSDTSGDRQLEHVLDKNNFNAFVKSSGTGKLQSGVISTYGPIPIAFWDRMENWDLSSEPGVPRLPGNSYPHERLFERALECLGSTNNPGVHMIVEKGINDAKNHMFQLHRFPAPDSISKYMELYDDDGTRLEKKKIKNNYRTILFRMRAGFSVLEYMRLDETRTRLNKIVKDVYVQFKFAETVYNRRYPGEKVHLANYWLDWIKDYLEQVAIKAKVHIEAMIKQVKGELDQLPDNSPYARNLRDSIDDYEVKVNEQHRMTIDTSGFPAFNSPITDEDGDEEMGGV